VALTIGQFVYSLVTSQLTVSAVLNPIVAIGISISFVYMRRDIARLIAKSDLNLDPGSNPGDDEPPRTLP
jgi:hypothetical protein